MPSNVLKKVKSKVKDLMKKVAAVVKPGTDCFETSRLPSVTQKFRSAFMTSHHCFQNFPLSSHTRLSATAFQHLLSIQPSTYSIFMCFGRRHSSIYSTSSSSSDEVPARIIDVPTVRRTNSPRCAPAGHAYNHAAEAASDSAGANVKKAHDKNKAGNEPINTKPGNKPQQTKK
ncbi:hypothetical protein M436DRAFT_67755 [Aureobasidium namibiae CBS 147.97]|uniref:Uncharacterized protein n=1 Tax=Aureobasidium namibiae CBS 147.97 TaxID=1043004 RepID=A0A074X2G3_9PEZI|nr:uncharacterized protein M436DRAFT_67755 [Aureobasidium namibiae CBS 147.97]KEQ68836.1 hypothetical protein M436DRAFT_67755 [Aureobasidium namibiae CBS 147.97]